MRKYLSIALVALMVFACGTALAYDAGFPSRGDLFLQTATIGNNPANNVGHTHVTTSPTLVWRVTLTSTAANTYCQLIDSSGTWGDASTAATISRKGAPVVGGGNKGIKADLGATTANTSYDYKFDPPIRFEEGVLAGVCGAPLASGGDALVAGAAVTAVIQYSAAE